jgi:hypothetical protein
MVKEGSGNGVSICMGDLGGKPGGRAPLLGTEGYVKRALETGISLHKGPVRGTCRGGGASFFGTLREG